MTSVDQLEQKRVKLTRQSSRCGEIRAPKGRLTTVYEAQEQIEEQRRTRNWRTETVPSPRQTRQKSNCTCNRFRKDFKSAIASVK